MPRSIRRTLLAVVGVGVAAALVLGALWASGRSTEDEPAAAGTRTTAPADRGTTAPVSAVPEPATNEGVATDPPAVTAGGDVQPMITQAGWAASGTAVEVSGFVSGVVEDGGTCRVVLTHGDETVTAERTAIADATTTACGVIEVGNAGMTSGWWQAVLSYESATSSGASTPVDVLVPTR